MNKKKIINDPVYGFITIPFDLVHDIIEHPWFQRLSRIRQLGLTYLVYPGALHTRFHHTIGALHLMSGAIETLRSKGHAISEEEARGACVAILMHDIGHGPFSHALENLLAKDISHEYLSDLIMRRLNKEFNNELDVAISIFNNEHPKKFLHQLVSSQLDVDRLDYLNRDSFFTGVSEGVISSDRIIKMLDVAEGNLVVEEKGIYSVEKFITARRLMYWQVYLHKTVLAAEHMLIHIIKRARELALNGNDLFGTPAFLNFLKQEHSVDEFESNDLILSAFAQLDDFDVFTSVKAWMDHPDPVLSKLCTGLVNRKLYRIELSKVPFDEHEIKLRRAETAAKLGIPTSEAHYFCFTDSIQNNAYNAADDKINILFKNGTITDIAVASDNFNIGALAKPVTRYFFCNYRWDQQS